MTRTIRILALMVMLMLGDVSAAEGESRPDSVFISGFVGHAQNYAIDCEVRSAVDWANFWGVKIGETEFLDALPRSDNPEVGFVGDPNDVWGRIPPYGYGVHAEPIAKTLREYGLKAEAHHDLIWDNLRREIDAGRPVIVWIIGGMWAGQPVNYAASDGSTVRVAAYEHTMTLVGYSTETVKVVDSASGHLDTYSLSDFLDSWAVLGNMAVLGSAGPAPETGTPPTSTEQDTSLTTSAAASQVTSGNRDQGEHRESVPTTVPASDQNPSPELDPEPVRPDNQAATVDTYIVQKGDYVIKLARRFGVDWQELARMNGLRYPYVIHTGEVLKLPVSQVQEALPEHNPTSSTMVQHPFHAFLPFAQHSQAE